ncbi:ribosome maturation factor RimM [Acidihalobacter aeolianus]|nr:ribosome maturation factor RimM [Acidihalobacter aeolianus]
MARVSAPFGIKGWVKVHSYAEPPGMLLDYLTWQVGSEGKWRERRVAEAREHGGPILLVRFEGIGDRDQADALRGSEVALPRQALESLPEGEYYWADLIGLHVVGEDGKPLGTIERMIETGANDVMVVRGERERLIPFLRPDVVREIDLSAGRMQVDWDADF